MWYLHKGSVFTFAPLSFGGVGMQAKKKIASWRSFLSWHNSWDPWPEKVPPLGEVGSHVWSFQQNKRSALRRWKDEPYLATTKDAMWISKKVAEKSLCVPTCNDQNLQTLLPLPCHPLGKILWARTIHHGSDTCLSPSWVCTKSPRGALELGFKKCSHTAHTGPQHTQFINERIFKKLLAEGVHRNFH